MAKRVLAAGFGEKGPIGIVGAFADNDRAIAVFANTFFHLGKESSFVESDFREHDDVWRIAFLLGSKAGSSRDPASMTAHYFHHEHLGRAFAHRGNIKAGFTNRNGNVFGH